MTADDRMKKRWKPLTEEKEFAPYYGDDSCTIYDKWDRYTMPPRVNIWPHPNRVIRSRIIKKMR